MENQFRAWFEVVYRDNPDEVDDIVSKWAEMIENEDFADDELSWEAEDVFRTFLLHDVVGDDAHLFAIDWKDSESLIAYLDDFAERFDFDFAWTDKNREQDNVETLLPLVVEKFNQHGVLFYSLETYCDFYYFVAIPKADKSDFERVSEKWGVEYTLV